MCNARPKRNPSAAEAESAAMFARAWRAAASVRLHTSASLSSIVKKLRAIRRP